MQLDLIRNCGDCSWEVEAMWLLLPVIGECVHLTITNAAPPCRTDSTDKAFKATNGMHFLGVEKTKGLDIMIIFVLVIL